MGTDRQFKNTSQPEFGVNVGPRKGAGFGADSGGGGILQGIGKIGQVAVGAVALFFGWKVYQDMKPHIQSELARRNQRGQ